MNRKIFQTRVNAALVAQGLSREQLAVELKLDRYWRKWLKRILEEGLARPNVNSEKMLQRVAERLGFSDSSYMWLEKQPRTDAIAEFRELWKRADSAKRSEILYQLAVWQSETPKSSQELIAAPDLDTGPDIVADLVEELSESENPLVIKVLDLLGDELPALMRIHLRKVDQTLPAAEIRDILIPQLITIVDQRFPDWRRKKGCQ